MKLDQKSSPIKFVVLSVIGVFLFMWPIAIDGGQPNIPLGHLINWLGDQFGQLVVGQYAQGDLGFNYLLTLLVIATSVVLTAVAYLAKPAFIMNNPVLKGIFMTHPIYIVSRVIALAVVVMVFFGVGPAQIIDAWTGDLMLQLTAGLVTLFLILGPTMPLVTDFGLMEFIGVLIQKIVRLLFTLPGRSSVDLMASWFGSSAVGVMITSDQQEKGFYSGREAAVIATNFSFVSLPFTFVIANTIDMAEHFWLFYLTMCVTCIILALILPRTWPLRSIPDTYVDGVGKQIDEDTPAGTSLFAHATAKASQRAANSSFVDILKAGGKNYLNIFFDLIPIILAWGTLALVLEAFTPVFDWISAPMGHYLNLLGVEGAFDYASATLVGFVDMFIPAILLSGAPLETRFILGILSIVQIIYLAETGALILKSKIPLGFGKLLALFIMRTVIGLPIIVLLTRLFLRY